MTAYSEKMIAYFKKMTAYSEIFLRLTAYFTKMTAYFRKMTAYFAAVYSTEKRDDDSAEGHVEQVAVVVVAKVPRNSG